ncbi:MAG: lipo-like protein [Deltaproteobacteria bacterium]|nr:lipo-like protein [Deltaproteobacteria bacterium]
MPSRLRRFLHGHAIRILTAPLARYHRSSGQDVDQLKRHVRKGDVLLVCGDQRVSEVIRYLTQSSWSHAAIYVGDEMLHRFPERRAELEARFGEEARHLVVEALVEEGVVISPISKYRGFHLRLCRPFGLEPPDLGRVMDLVIERLGCVYDLANLFDLARYFLPVSLVPARFRREALQFGRGRPTEVICSSMIASAFEAVGFPILPRTQDESGQPASGSVYHAGIGAPSWPSRRPLARHLRMQKRPAGLITPRDFDLSPYFEIVKFSLIEEARAATPAPAAPRRTARVFPLWSRFRRVAGVAAVPAESAERVTG